MITKKELSIVEERALDCAKESYQFVDNIEPERILALVGEVRKLQEVLKWYADVDNGYIKRGDGNYYLPDSNELSPYDEDAGMRARAALNKGIK